MSTPQVSVIMGVLHRQGALDALERAVCSILMQDETNFEFLICDDGSNLETVRLLDKLAQEDCRIHLLRPGEKITLSQKLNYCIMHAKGTYIARMDDDDYSHAKRFTKQIEFLETNLNFAFAGCNVNLNCAGATVGRRIFPEAPTVRDFFMVQPYIHPAIMFRREALAAVGGYSEDKHAFLCEDYDLLLRLYAAGYPGFNLQEILFDYTIPVTAKGSRKMTHRWNEAITRYRRFRQLNLLPAAWPYVIKPLAVGLLPEQVLRKLKKNYVYS